MNDASPIDVRQLLTIDVASELRKLSQAQLQGPWQIPAEFVRYALRRGARQVRVDTSRDTIIITDKGPAFDHSALEAATTLMQPGHDDDARHGALAHLEQQGGLALLAAAGLPRKQIRIRVESLEHHIVLSVSRGSVSLERLPPTGTQRNSVELSSPDLERKRVRGWLDDVGRFSGGRVILDGRPLDDGWAGMLAHAPLGGVVTGHVGIPHDGEHARVWLLEHGLVTGHLSAPDAPCFEAAIELGSDATDLSASRLRDATRPHISHIVGGAVRLACTVGGRADSLSEPQRSRLAKLILAAARRRIETNEVWAAPVFRIVEGGSLGLTTLANLREASASSRPSGALLALYPSQDPKKFATADRLVLIADAGERSSLAECLGTRFRPPRPKEGRRSVGAFLRASVQHMQRRARQTMARLAAANMRPLQPSAHTEHERRFLERTAEHLRGSRDAPGVPTKLVLCTGRGVIRIGGPTADELWLPRDNPTVAAAIAAVVRHPTWTYPALLALLGGRGLPSVASRKAWMERLHEPNENPSFGPRAN